jgi:PAS domain S-box-containing protein
MDIMLTGPIDGISAAQHLRPLGVPVVYLTAYSDRHLIDRAQHTQPLGYIIKPTNSTEIAAMIQLALFKKEQEGAREKEHAAQLVAEGDERFRLLVAAVTEFAVFTLDSAGNINSWNRGAERIHGYSAREILGQPHSILFSPEDREAGVPGKELQAAMEKGSADDTRWMLRRSGESFWAEGVLTAVRDHSTALTGFTKIVRDGTERKHLQEELAAKEERLRIAMRAARTGTWHWDLRTNIDKIDDNLRVLFGLRSENEIQTIEDFFALVHPDDQARVRAAFDETRRAGVHLDTEFRVVRPDGSMRWLLDQGAVVSQDGKAAYMTGACVDVTERKQAQEDLRLSEERFRLFVDNVRDYALFQMDTDGRITSWNSGAELVLGYKAEEMLGQPAARLFTPEDRAAGEPEKEIRDAAARGSAQDERWHVRKDHSRFWCSGVLTAMYDDHDRLRGFAKVMRDETERRERNEQLKSSLEQKEILLKEIHHRVKNNLQVITSLLRLQADSVEGENVQHIFDEACNRVRAIGEIHELLYRSPDLAAIDFSLYLKRLGENIQAFYDGGRERIAVVIDANANLPISEAISCGLIVNELLTNSLKHAFPGGRSGFIKVSLRCALAQCILEVADNGIGLPEGLQFHEAGTLGLKLVSVLAKQLRGVIQVEREGGTAIRVIFPNGSGERKG